MRGVEPGTETPSHMAPLNSRGKLTTFWIIFTKIQFCACVVLKMRQQCHPTRQPETLWLNGQRFGSFFTKIHFCACLVFNEREIQFCACVVFKMGQQCHPTRQPETLWVNGHRFGSFFTKIHFCACLVFNERDRNAIPHGN